MLYSFLEMSVDQMVNAIGSQGFLQYEGSAADNNSVFTKKPIFYYVVGDDDNGVLYANLSAEVEVLNYLNLNAGAYDFDAGLVAAQIAAIESRVDLDNQYMYRFAFLPRVGDHTVVFSSNSNGFNYSLTSTYAAADLVPFAALGTPADVLASLVEITGPNGEFLANDEASLAEVQTFAAATRWVNETYTAADYSWAIVAGTATLTDNGDGTATVSDKVSATVTLRLTNAARGETADIVIGD